MSRQLIKGTLIFSVAAIVSAVLNALFYTIGKIIGPEQFGIVVAMISLSYLIIIVQNIISTLVTKVVAANPDLNTRYLSAQLRPAMIKLQLFSLLFLLAFGLVFLQSYLKLDSFAPFIFLGLGLVSAYLLAMYRGIMRGRSMFGEVAITQVFEVLLKISLGFAAALLATGVEGILTAIALATVFSTFLAAFLAARPVTGKTKTTLNKLFGRELLASIGVSMVVLNLMFIVDSIIARNALSAVNAGIYAAVITFGKFIYFLTNSVTLTLFPLSADKRVKGDLLLKSSVLTIVLGVISLIGFLLTGEQLSGFFFGGEFAGLSAYLPVQALIITIYALISQINAFLLAKDDKLISAFLVIGLLVQMAGLSVFGRSVDSLLNVQLLVMSMLFGVCLLYLFFRGMINAK